MNTNSAMYGSRLFCMLRAVVKRFRYAVGGMCRSMCSVVHLCEPLYFNVFEDGPAFIVSDFAHW